jgi:hypothetical protein
LEKGGHHGCSLTRKKEVDTEGVKWVSRVDTMVSFEGHSNKEQREVGTLLKKGLRSWGFKIRKVPK